MARQLHAHEDPRGKDTHVPPAAGEEAKGLRTRLPQTNEVPLGRTTTPRADGTGTKSEGKTRSEDDTGVSVGAYFF